MTKPIVSVAADAGRGLKVGSKPVLELADGCCAIPLAFSLAITQARDLVALALPLARHDRDNRPILLIEPQPLDTFVNALSRSA
ncbi:MAG: hypothetical protein U1F37_00690 [Alphaproteobacteria bacterium]